MLDVEARGPVLFVRIDRPEVRNAFNDELIGRLHETFTSVPDGIRAIVISGNGSAFCAGGDLSWMQKAAGYTLEQNQADALLLAKMLEAVANAPAFVLALVHGPAFGGGCGLVCASDYAIATPAANFAFSEVRLGLVPATISPFAVEKIGPGNARALFMSGLAFDAERACRIGLVQEVVDAEVFQEATDRVLKAVLSAGPEAVLKSRQLGRAPSPDAAANALTLAEARASGEGKEGVAAFLEKRRASFAVKWPREGGA